VFQRVGSGADKHSRHRRPRGTSVMRCREGVGVGPHLSWAAVLDPRPSPLPTSATTTWASAADVSLHIRNECMWHPVIQIPTYPCRRKGDRVWLPGRTGHSGISLNPPWGRTRRPLFIPRTPLVTPLWRGVRLALIPAGWWRPLLPLPFESGRRT
jgi:hypothetical protein